MYANEILKHYRNKFDNNGFVDVTKDVLDEEFFSGYYTSSSKLKLKCGTFYKKLGELGVAKAQMDAEVLLCQVYHKLGFKTAVYVPAQTDFSQFILCNDIQTKNVVPAFEYHFELGYEHRGLEGSPDCLFNGDKRDYVPLFSPNILRKRAEMFLTDATALNYDRVDCNYYYLLNKKTGTPADIILIDYESSGENFNHAEEFRRKYTPSDNYLDKYNTWLTNNAPSTREHYQSDFNPMYLSREELIEKTKDCEELDGVFDANEFASRIGSVDINAVAKDIKREINYKVNQKYVDVLDKRFENTAEMLMSK